MAYWLFHAGEGLEVHSPWSMVFESVGDRTFAVCPTMTRDR